jgi:hypothetical protein
MFLPQLIEELEVEGRTLFLDDPSGSFWAILDRAIVGVGRVVSDSELVIEISEDKDDGLDAEGVISKEDFVSDKDRRDGVGGRSHSGSMAELLICLKAMQLLMARYHPELHRVVPIYALCDLLCRGVNIKSIPKPPPSDPQPTVRVKDLGGDLCSWINMVLGVLQLRLSGPISRDDWSDFVAGGGSKALCMILTSPVIIGVETNPNPNPNGISNSIREDGSADIQKNNELLVLAAQLLQNLVFSSGSRLGLWFGLGLGLSIHNNIPNPNNNSNPSNNPNNNPNPNPNRYAMAFASPSGLDQLSRALWILSRRFQFTNIDLTIIDTYLTDVCPLKDVVEKRDTSEFSNLSDKEQKEDREQKGSTASISSKGCCSPSISAALSSLVAVAQRVFEISRGNFEEEIDDSELRLLLVDKRMLLMRIIVVCSIHIEILDDENQVININDYDSDENNDNIKKKNNARLLTSRGTLSVSAAKLLRDLLISLDSVRGTTGKIIGSSICNLDVFLKFQNVNVDYVPL